MRGSENAMTCQVAYGELLIALKEWKEAIVVLRRALLQRPHDAQASIALAQALLSHMRSRALENAAKKVGIVKGNKCENIMGPKEDKGVLEQEKIPNRVKEETGTPFDLKSAERAQAQEAKRVEDLEAQEALKILEDVIKRDVRHVRALVALGSLHERAGALALAQVCLSSLCETLLKYKMTVSNPMQKMACRCTCCVD